MIYTLQFRYRKYTKKENQDEKKSQQTYFNNELYIFDNDLAYL